MDDMIYRYLDALDTVAIGLLVAIIAIFCVYLTFEGIRSSGADDGGLSRAQRRAERVDIRALATNRNTIANRWQRSRSKPASRLRDP